MWAMRAYQHAEVYFNVSWGGGFLGTPPCNKTPQNQLYEGYFGEGGTALNPPLPLSPRSSSPRWTPNS